MTAEIGNNGLIDTWGSGGLVSEPAIGKIQTGWQVSEYPPAETMNWIHNTLGQQVNYLLRSGVAAWSSDTPYIAGDVVTRTGDLWMALSGSTDSAPTSINPNWRRVPRLENISVVGRTGAYADLTGIPSTFQPVAHTHTLAQITDLSALSQSQWVAGTSNTEAVVSPAKIAAAIAANTGQQVPPGTIFHIAGSAVPAGYLKANGEAVSRTTYAALFAAIGTTYGEGNASTTFNMPDLRGEFVRGWSDDRLGVDAGRSRGSGQQDQLKAHRHNSVDYGSAGFSINQKGIGPTTFGETISGAPATQKINLTGLTGGAETRPRNVALLAVIKT